MHLASCWSVRLEIWSYSVLPTVCQSKACEILLCKTCTLQKGLSHTWAAKVLIPSSFWNGYNSWLACIFKINTGHLKRKAFLLGWWEVQKLALHFLKAYMGMVFGCSPPVCCSSGKHAKDLEMPTLIWHPTVSEKDILCLEWCRNYMLVCILEVILITLFNSNVERHWTQLYLTIRCLKISLARLPGRAEEFLFEKWRNKSLSATKPRPTSNLKGSRSDAAAKKLRAGHLVGGEHGIGKHTWSIKWLFGFHPCHVCWKFPAADFTIWRRFLKTSGTFRYPQSQRQNFCTQGGCRYICMYLLMYKSA